MLMTRLWKHILTGNKIDLRAKKQKGPAMDVLVSKLQRANWAYRNTDTLLMTDEEYDKGIEELRRLSPSHPFLSLVGAEPDQGQVLLPYIMGSLDKVRDGDGLTRWKKRMNAVSKFILSEKLDGISCLYMNDGKTRKMYLRGDGVKGVDISWLASYLKLPASPCVVRGELILKEANTPEGSIGRSVLNGWVHNSKRVTKDLEKIDFLVYQMLDTQKTRMEQMNWIREAGFQVPWIRVVAAPGFTEDLLSKVLLARKQESEYPIDGIVVCADIVPWVLGGGEAKNPGDCIAYKMSLAEQKAETNVIQVEWNISRQGFLIPRVQVEEVVIGGAKINWLSGHNASLIYKNGVGPGARIVLLRSGDVIPKLDSMIKKVQPSMPAEGTWAWDSGEKHIVLLKADGAGATKEENNRSLLHAMTTLEVDGAGPGIVVKLVNAGIDTLKKVLATSSVDLGKVIGPGRGPAMYEGLRARIAVSSPSVRLIASNLLPRGIGERRLRLLTAINPDPRKWNKNVLKDVGGWGDDVMDEFLSVLPSCLKWCEDTFGPFGPFSPLEHQSPEAVPIKGHIVFSGVRDKVLEGELLTKGWIIDDAVSKKTTVLVVSDDYKETGKVKKAREAGISIKTLSAFRAQV